MKKNIRKGACLFSFTTIFLFTSCAHNQTDYALNGKNAQPKILAKSFFDLIKVPTLPATGNGKKRRPAQETKEIPGLKDFISAVKKHPEFLRIPIGYAIKNVSKSKMKGVESDESSMTTTHFFLKQSEVNHIALTDNSVDGLTLQIEDNPSIIPFNEEMFSDTVKVVHLGGSKYSVGVNDCNLKFDLEQFAGLMQLECELSDYSVNSTSTLEKFEIQSVKEKLSNVKMSVIPTVLDEYSDLEDESWKAAISDSEARDWSFLLGP